MIEQTYRGSILDRETILKILNDHNITEVFVGERLHDPHNFEPYITITFENDEDLTLVEISKIYEKFYIFVDSEFGPGTFYAPYIPLIKGPST